MSLGSRINISLLCCFGDWFFIKCIAYSKSVITTTPLTAALLFLIYSNSFNIAHNSAVTMNYAKIFIQPITISFISIRTYKSCSSSHFLLWTIGVNLYTSSYLVVMVDTFYLVPRLIYGPSARTTLSFCFCSPDQSKKRKRLSAFRWLCA